MHTVSYEDSFSCEWLELLLEVDGSFGVGLVADLLPEYQRWSLELPSMTLHVGIVAVLAVIMEEVIGVAEALHSQGPILVGQAGLKENRPSALNDGAISTLYHPVRFMPIWVGDIVTDPAF